MTSKPATTSRPSPDPLMDRARRLGLYGLLARWQELGDQPWVRTLIECEEAERSRRSLGFTVACQTILASWMLLSTGSCANTRALHDTLLTHIAENEVANRPGRIEPRVLKRRRHRYPLMQRPRDQLRLQCGKT